MNLKIREHITCIWISCYKHIIPSEFQPYPFQNKYSGMLLTNADYSWPFQKGWQTQSQSANIFDYIL